MKIKVTQEHINKGEPKSACSCPVALALKEVFKVWIDVNYIFIDIADDASFLTPDSVLDFIKKFDTGQPVKPFEFELRD